MLNHPELNNEQKIILLTASQILTDEHLIILKSLLGNNPDWHFIASFSEAHGTAPLLYKALNKNYFAQFVPADIFNHLKNIYFQTQAKNLLALYELKNVLLAFNKAGIDTILLKGMASAEFIYKDAGLRPMGDIDFMVEPHKILDAEKIFFDLGFINTVPYKSFKLRTLNINTHLNAFVKNHIAFELHRDLSAIHHIYRIPLNIIWENITKTSIDNVPIYVLNTDLNIMYLSLHSVQHMLKKKIRLNSFTDISELIKQEKENIDWEKIIHKSKQFNISIPVYKSLDLCKEFLNTPVPLYVTEKLKKENISLEQEFLLMLNNQTEKIKFKAPSDYIKKIVKIEGLTNKLKYMWTELFPSKDYIIYHYNLKNKKIFVFYYFIQFYRQAIKSFKNIFHL